MEINNKPDSEREQKRAQFAAPAQAKSGSRKNLLIGAGVFLALFAFLMFKSSSNNSAPATVAGTNQGAAAGEIRIPLTDLSDKAQFFDYAVANDKKVRFFVVKSADGVYRAALDACDVCYHAQKGYSQDGADMVCNNCGMRFHTSLINEVSGGCNPIGLTRVIQDNQLIIKTAELSNGGRFF